MSREGDEEPPERRRVSLSMHREKDSAVLASCFDLGWVRNWPATQQTMEKEKRSSSDPRPEHGERSELCLCPRAGHYGSCGSLMGSCDRRVVDSAVLRKKNPFQRVLESKNKQILGQVPQIVLLGKSSKLSA